MGGVKSALYERRTCLLCDQVKLMHAGWVFCRPCWSKLRAERKTLHYQLEQVRTKLGF